MLAWNVNGLARKINDIDFVDKIKQYDLILLSETWISNKHSINLEIQGFDNFQIFGHKTRGVKKGGMAEV